MVVELQGSSVLGFGLPIPESPGMTKYLVMKKLIVLSVGILLLQSSFEGFKSLPILYRMGPMHGNLCQIVVFVSFSLSLIFLPKLTIGKMGCKTTILLSCLAYSLFMMFSLTPTIWVLLPISALLGLGASNLWCSVFTYINEISYVPSGDILQPYQQAIGSHFYGVFYLLFQLYHILPNVLSYTVKEDPLAFNSTGKINAVSKNAVDTVKNVSYFCATKLYGSITQNMPIINDHGNFLFFSYFIISVFAIIFISLFLEQLNTKNKTDHNQGLVLDVTATLRQTIKVDQLLLMFISAFIGFERENMYKEYILPCPWIWKHNQEYFLYHALEISCMCLFMIWMTNYVHRYVVLVPAAVCYIVVAYATSEPCSRDPGHILGVTMIWGFCDVVFQTQITALYGDLFRTNQEAAFANYILFVSGGMICTCTGILLPVSKVTMQLLFLAIAMVGYIIVEIRFYRRTYMNGNLVGNVLWVLGGNTFPHEKLENADSFECFSTKEVALIPKMILNEKPT